MHLDTKDINSLTLMCHPYVFALKEGKLIGDDPLDYSLLLLQRQCAEILYSPTNQAARIFMMDCKPVFIEDRKKAIVV